jgi:BRCT domain type II-containing protein
MGFKVGTKEPVALKLPKKIAITGAFESMSRIEAQGKLEALGVDVTSGVSSKTELLIAGARAGSKLAKAQNLGIPMWTEAQLVAAVANAPEVAPKPSKPAKVYTDVKPALAGKVVVLTGTFQTMKRRDAQALCAAAGATNGSGVTKSTDLLVVGEKAGSKLAKAQQLGIEIISEAELYEMLEREMPGEEASEEAEEGSSDSGGIAPLKLIETTPGNYSLLMNVGDTKVDELVFKLGHEPNGYFWEGVAEVLVQTEANQLEERVNYDPEGSMFCAFGEDKAALNELGVLMASVANGPERMKGVIAKAKEIGFEFDD